MRLCISLFMGAIVLVKEMTGMQYVWQQEQLVEASRNRKLIPKNWLNPACFRQISTNILWSSAGSAEILFMVWKVSGIISEVSYSLSSHHGRAWSSPGWYYSLEPQFDKGYVIAQCILNIHISSYESRIMNACHYVFGNRNNV